MSPGQVGTIGWIDLTVPNAAEIRDFYQGVTGWSAREVPMGGYSDFCMLPAPNAAPVDGICHARGTNADLPPQWLIYITVANLDISIPRYVELGRCSPAPRNWEARDACASFAILRAPWRRSLNQVNNKHKSRSPS